MNSLKESLAAPVPFIMTLQNTNLWTRLETSLEPQRQTEMLQLLEKQKQIPRIPQRIQRIPSDCKVTVKLGFVLLNERST
mmetsp:Transcript_21034/g.57968  ORF Transcript_21034/g.57968 Transcript_21034/m.57968 type:complete len:80 (-) Transcript_21034:417-656(-)